MALLGPFDAGIDPWEVDHGPEVAADPSEEPPEEIELDVEVAPGRWRPILPYTPATPERLLFVDCA